MLKILKKYRQRILPWVEDWSSSQDHIRNEKDVGKLSYAQWFFCHPTALTLVLWSINILGFLLFGFISVLAWIKGLWILFAIALFMAITQIQAIYRKIKVKGAFDDMTFYDIMLRDTMPEVKNG